MLLENWTTVLGDAVSIRIIRRAAEWSGWLTFRPQITAGRDYKQTVLLSILVIGWALLANFILIQLLVAVINEVSHR